MPPSTHPPGETSSPTPAFLFGLAWTELAAALGTTALAVLVRRARDRAVPDCSTLHEFGIERDGFGYRYRLPAAWSSHDPEAAADLTTLVQALVPLLAELTGPVAIRRLAAVEPLWTMRIIGEEHLARWSSPPAVAPS
jgi:hypothetical protein